jgi:hypothetical protein
MDKRAHDLQCYSRVRFEDTIRIQYGGSNVIGVTALHVMRPVLIVARRVDKSVEVFFSTLALPRYVTSDWATSYAKLQW